MKRNIICLFAFFCGLSCIAENIVQMKPLKTTAGVTSSKSNVIEIELSNSDDTYAIQIDMYLPEGMALPQKSSGSLYTTLDEEVEDDLEFTCSSSYNSSEKHYTVMIYTTTTNVIPKGGCTVLTIRYTTDNNMPDGVYPIIFKATKIETGEHDKIVVPETSSYIVIGDSKSPSTSTDVDLSGMTGYIPSFVVNQLNMDIASNTNLRSLNLSGTTFANLGAELSVPNNDNLLWYTSDKASLNRNFKGEQWNTVCLPFTLQTSYLNASTVVKEMAEYDGEATITLGDVTTMETGKPYLIYSSTDGQLIKDVTISNPVAVPSETSTTTSNSLTMRGTYQEATVKSDGGYTRYGFTNGKFVMLGTGAATVPPFRAYLEYLGKSSTRSINIAGDGTTGINTTISDDESNGPLYDLKGVMVNEGQQAKGIYVRNGKKQILK